LLPAVAIFAFGDISASHDIVNQNIAKKISINIAEGKYREANIKKIKTLTSKQEYLCQ
jgi:hypothetical protein